MTVEALKECNKRRLAQFARDKGIAGWHAMRKDQLIRALSGSRPAPAKSVKKKKARPAAVSAARRKKPGSVSASPMRRGSNGTANHLAAAPADHTLDHACQKDRIIVLTRDSYWLHAYWELSRTTLSRARAALGQDWHEARPILRVMDVSSEDTTSVRPSGTSATSRFTVA